MSGAYTFDYDNCEGRIAMKVTVLMENVTPSARFAARHGLSLFLESQGARILFDVGPDEFFLENALAVGVDVRSAHAVVISHGHSDHGGGLRAYLDATSKLLAPAPIYVNEHAFEPHAAGTPESHRNIGLDPTLAGDPRFLKIGDQVALGDNLLLFSAVSFEYYQNFVVCKMIPKSNLFSVISQNSPEIGN